MNRYSVILADPPWSYKDKKPRGGAEKHYRTMTVKDVMTFGVEGRTVHELAEKDAVLFLWATWPLLPDALEVISAWGFKFKTNGFVWVKTTKSGSDAFGLGRHTRGNTEPCLLATRGRGLERINASVRQVVLTEEPELVCEPRGRHSAKPPIVRDRIVQLYGDVPRIELFARERCPGWDCHGDQLHPEARP